MKTVADKTEAQKTGRTDLMLVDPKNISIEPDFNVRVDMGDIEGLAHSVVSLGVIDAIKGFKVRGEDRYIMTEGHRRLEAVLLAHRYHAEGKKGFEDISKIERIQLVPCSSDLEDRLYIMGATGEKKKNLTELERADLYKRLISLGETKGKKRSEVINEIKERMGVSTATVYNLLQLNDVDQDIKDFIASNQISGGVVLSIIKEVKEPEEQKKLVLEAVYDAEEKAKASGGTKKTKATAANVKGLVNKTPIQKLKELAEQLETKGIKNQRSKLLNELIDALEEKATVKSMVSFFE